MKSVDIRTTLNLREGQSLELLKELHILTREGKINQDSHRKLKQVYHLVQFIETAIQTLQSTRGNSSLTLLDVGSGKSYLGFILYDLIFKHLPQTYLYGIESQERLVDQCKILAKNWQFDRIRFIASTIYDAISCTQLPEKIDVITALHACDTATDDAIALGLKKQAKLFVLVPCCQAEIARLLNSKKQYALGHNVFAELWRQPLHTREFGSHITNVLRCLYLQAVGYQVTVTELVGFEHSMKNELIMAHYSGKRSHTARQRLTEILSQTGLSELLRSRFILADN